MSFLQKCCPPPASLAGRSKRRCENKTGELFILLVWSSSGNGPAPPGLCSIKQLAQQCRITVTESSVECIAG
ncbi:MAG: hypothetical protein OJF50_002348 [Nitrospira sp.]|nr:hypothetical protein [Nitrospira sp.]